MKQTTKNIEYRDISDTDDHVFNISDSKTYIFYFKNKQGDLIFNISSENATVYIFGIYDAYENQNFSLNTYQIHKEKNSESHVLIKGIFRNKSSLNYRGIIDIKKDSSNSIASLENRNLLLDEFASVITNPILKIRPHKVICTHAATISNINKEHTEFLKTRGISENDAKKLLIEGFLADIKQKINLLLK